MLLETRDCPGFKVGRILDKIGQKGQDTCELFLMTCMCPPMRCLAASKAGLRTADDRVTV
jgi:acyl-CoA dehydrogenase